ncbi:hypothetical protein C8F01DRAFT_1259514 [Mycena amicta]|nr:hypothetical protein C8F01DRAFT_1259514 [Mycena amicta]
MSLNPNQLPTRTQWRVRFGAGAVTPGTRSSLDPETFPVLFSILHDFQYWFSMDDVRAREALAGLTLPKSTNRNSEPFRRRMQHLAAWIYTNPPPIELLDLSDRAGYILRESCTPDTAFFAQSQQIRRQSACIHLAARLIRELVVLHEESMKKEPAEHTLAKLHMLSFFITRTLLHQVAHTARSIFCNKPTFIPGPDTTETHTGDGPNWELERITGGKVHLCMSQNSSLSEFSAEDITGLRLEVAHNEYRYVDFHQTLLLHRLGHVNWSASALLVPLSKLPPTATFSNDPVLGDGTMRACELCVDDMSLVVEDSDSASGVDSNPGLDILQLGRPAQLASSLFLRDPDDSESEEEWSDSDSDESDGGPHFEEGVFILERRCGT